MFKKTLVGLIIALISGGIYFTIAVLKAEPVKDYPTISPTVKIESYRLSRGGDIFQAAQASATLISPSGLLLTNSHVVLDEEKEPYDVFAVCLTFDKNQEPVCEYTASLKAYDRDLDLALLQLNVQDNRGNVLPELNYLPYDFSGYLEIGGSVDVFGYPDTGGKTLTQTRGQLAGYELKNEVNYLKTDADISSGNSGGTALDEDGNFVGIPTYVISSLENLGYVLDIKQAAEFITEYLTDEPSVNSIALAQLKVKLNLFNDARDSGNYQHPYYPRFKMSLSSGWEWDEIDKNYLALLSRSNKGNKNIEINIHQEPYKIHEEYLKEFMRIINLYTDYLTDYKEERVSFAGSSATLLTYNSGSEKNFSYFIPYGHALLMIKYQVALDSYEKDLADFQKVLGSFAFTDKPVDDPVLLSTLVKIDPPFSIGQVNDWRLQESQQPRVKELIATWENSKVLKGNMQISYRKLEEDWRNLINEQIFKQLLLSFQQSYSRKLINKDGAVVLDNLSGWSITYTEPGRENQTVDKVSEVSLRDGDYLYQISYINTADQYVVYLEDFKAILKTFKNYRQEKDQIGRGKYQFGPLDYAYSDIGFHRFEQSITKLADKGIVYGYTDGSFRPEKIIMAAEAKKFIQNSLKETKRANTKEDQLAALPEGEVTLNEAMEVLGKVFNLDVWQNAQGDAPSWKPYLDKAWQIGLIPSGLSNPEAKLTRAEFSYILDNLLDSFEAI